MDHSGNYEGTGFIVLHQPKPPPPPHKIEAGQTIKLPLRGLFNTTDAAEDPPLVVPGGPPFVK